MNLLCSMIGHKRAATKKWDGEFYHSSCVRCGMGLVRLSGDRDWREPDDTEKRYFEKMKDTERLDGATSEMADANSEATVGY